jgi:hypothetical protein
MWASPSIRSSGNVEGRGKRETWGEPRAVQVVGWKGAWEGGWERWAGTRAGTVALGRGLFGFDDDHLNEGYNALNMKSELLLAVMPPHRQLTGQLSHTDAT